MLNFPWTDEQRRFDLKLSNKSYTICQTPHFFHQKMRKPYFSSSYWEAPVSGAEVGSYSSVKPGTTSNDIISACGH